MLDLRKVVFQALKGDPDLSELVEDRIFQRSSLEEGVPPAQIPYIVYHFGESFGTGPTIIKAQRQTVQVWVHDRAGDYFRIDEILDRVKVVLEHIEEGDPDGFLGIRHLQTSPDLWDDLTKHIVRYGRYAATMSQSGEADA
jgi:hypothetical protein